MHAPFKVLPVLQLWNRLYKKVRKRAFLGWNQKIQNVAVISYIVMCISVDGTMPLGDILSKQRNRSYIGITESVQ